MNTPWKVVGFESWLNEEGKERVRLYLARPLAVDEGHTGEGLEATREFYTPKYLNSPYKPACGQMIIFTKGRYGINEIFVVGMDRNA